MAATVTAGCVVLPVNVYVADASVGALVYETCSLTAHLPARVELRHSRLHAIVSIVHSQGMNLVRVQYDVPKGSSLVLLEAVIEVVDKEGDAARRATIPNTNPAAPARYPETPAIQKLVLPVTHRCAAAARRPALSASTGTTGSRRLSTATSGARSRFRCLRSPSKVRQLAFRRPLHAPVRDRQGLQLLVS